MNFPPKPMALQISLTVDATLFHRVGHSTKLEVLAWVSHASTIFCMIYQEAEGQYTS